MYLIVKSFFFFLYRVQMAVNVNVIIKPENAETWNTNAQNFALSILHNLELEKNYLKYLYTIVYY